MLQAQVSTCLNLKKIFRNVGVEVTSTLAQIEHTPQTTLVSGVSKSKYNSNAASNANGFTGCSRSGV